MNLSRLTVQLLRAQLLARNRNAKGTKAVLVKRLGEALQEEGIDVTLFVARLIGNSVTGEGQNDERQVGQSAASATSPVVTSLVDGGSRPSQSDIAIDAVDPEDCCIEISGAGARLRASAAGQNAVRDPVNQRAVCPDEDVQPADSASHDGGSVLSRGSARSSLASTKAQESARRAALKVKMKFLKERQMLELREQELKMKKEELKLREALEESEAFEAALSESGPNSTVSTAVGGTGNSTQERISPISRPATPPPAPEARRTENEDHQASLMKKLLTSCVLPKPDIPVFSGDFARFHQFLRAFDGRVASVVVDEEEKLRYLEQFTSGTPRDIVRGCMFMKTGGYEEAKRLLMKRYGNPDRMAESFIDRLVHWPLVKGDDVAGLDKLAVEMRACHNAVDSLKGASHELNHPKTMKKILEKLPFAIQEKWRREVDRLAEGEGRSALFSDLVSLMEVEARIASNAAFGRQVFLKKDLSRADKSQETKVKCNYVKTKDAETEKKICVLCKHEHDLSACPVFAEKTLVEREKLVRQHALCFGCLEAGHRSRWCKSRLTCMVCGKGHPSVLHRYQTATVSHDSPPMTLLSDQRASQAAVNVLSSRRAGHSGVKMPIVPVKVKYQGETTVQTYALLDSGSSSTFCSQLLLDKLGVPTSAKTKLSVITMARDPLKVWTAPVEGLSICGIDESDPVDLPEVFSLGSIPASREEVCRVDDLSDWPRLQEVVPPDIDAEVGLLIGVNVPAALEPVDFIKSRDGGPFAVKTRLGWVVQGRVRHLRPTQPKSTTNRIKVEPQQLHLDGSLATGERHLSVEDPRWRSDDTVQPPEVRLRNVLPFGARSSPGVADCALGQAAEASGERSSWLKPDKPLETEDAVVIADSGLQRIQRPLGRVIERRASQDGLVRSVNVKTKGREMWRPVTKLVSLC
ncbi:uncharacterized protein LOC122380240 [Amphibalanus amphitrite]|uniref:uncharacterized protein LOC122380240 n=1 Tax=Amphibalanus amphitrite TaxID=1232801 RepID=UPI001C8FAB4D|nr:uncharacterized protein LOC122380240 [Amphibalanus amphitrite]